MSEHTITEDSPPVSDKEIWVMLEIFDGEVSFSAVRSTKEEAIAAALECIFGDEADLDYVNVPVGKIREALRKHGSTLPCGGGGKTYTYYVFKLYIGHLF